MFTAKAMASLKVSKQTSAAASKIKNKILSEYKAVYKDKIKILVMFCLLLLSQALLPGSAASLYVKDKLRKMSRHNFPHIFQKSFIDHI